jgi:hypothetical protein
MNITIRMVLAAFMAAMVAGCSTVESRIRSNPQAFYALSPTDQALVLRGEIRTGMPESAVLLAMGKPDHTRSGVRYGRPFEAWVYTTIQSEVVPDFYPGLYGFGYYRYHPRYGYGGYWRMRGGFYGAAYDPFWDNVISYEVPYRTVFFENGRCTGWDNRDR